MKRHDPLGPPGRSKGAVVITGASTGIGRCCALSLMEAGYTVFAGVRNREAAQELTEASDGRLQALFLDVTNPDMVHRAVGRVAESFDGARGLHALVNNAGITLPGLVEFVALEALRNVFEVNVVGQLAVIQAFLPLLRRVRGRIIQIGSALGRLALPLTGPYAASKYAIGGLTEALRRELKPWGMHVVLIEPGSVSSAIWGKIDAQIRCVRESLPPEASERYFPVIDTVRQMWDQAERRAVPPEAVVKAVLHALQSTRPKNRYAVGWDGHFVSIVSRWVPARIIDRVLQARIRRSPPALP